MIKEFFKELYYKNDILAKTGINCYNSSTGEVEPEEVITAIKENNLKIIIE